MNLSLTVCVTQNFACQSALEAVVECAEMNALDLACTRKMVSTILRTLKSNASENQKMYDRVVEVLCTTRKNAIDYATRNGLSKPTLPDDEATALLISRFGSSHL